MFTVDIINIGVLNIIWKTAEGFLSYLLFKGTFVLYFNSMVYFFTVEQRVLNETINAITWIFIIEGGFQIFKLPIILLRTKFLKVFYMYLLYKVKNTEL